MISLGSSLPSSILLPPSAESLEIEAGPVAGYSQEQALGCPGLSLTEAMLFVESSGSSAAQVLGLTRQLSKHSCLPGLLMLGCRSWLLEMLLCAQFLTHQASAAADA